MLHELKMMEVYKAQTEKEDKTLNIMPIITGILLFTTGFPLLFIMYLKYIN